MDIQGMMRALWAYWSEHDWGDLEGSDMHDMALRHGLLYERPITAEEAKEEWAAEWDLEEGDLSSFVTDEFKTFLALKDKP